jgi:hypothetical protein
VGPIVGQTLYGTTRRGGGAAMGVRLINQSRSIRFLPGAKNSSAEPEPVHGVAGTEAEFLGGHSAPHLRCRPSRRG